MYGLLKWHARGITEVRDFARAWLDVHLKGSTVAKYSGPKSRIFSAGGVPITTYAGHYGLTFPCYEMATQFGDQRARRICLDIAKIILHQATRNRLGLVAHDDTAEFAIPDTCYFAVSALMFAWRLDPANGSVYRDQAVIQLRSYIDTFLVKDTGLAKTMLLKDGLGKTYWTRASGWLLWAITAVLRYLPPSAPEFAGFVADLKALASGYARVQDAGGGFRLLLDEPASPLETSGAVMCALGLHEAIRSGWLDSGYRSVAEKAWKYACGKITDDGMVHEVFAAWAEPAERRVSALDKRDSGFAAGFVLCAADEMTR
jgi:rhamnogalacturonyl hydrolase YesR